MIEVHDRVEVKQREVTEPSSVWCVQFLSRQLLCIPIICVEQWKSGFNRLTAAFDRQGHIVIEFLVLYPIFTHLSFMELDPGLTSAFLGQVSDRRVTRFYRDAGSKFSDGSGDEAKSHDTDFERIGCVALGDVIKLC